MIMQAVRPRGFVSNLMLAVAAVIDKKYGSSDLIKWLANLDICSSYDETQQFEASILCNKNQAEITNGYLQMMADNADWNTQTATGYGALHSMGVSMSSAPKESGNSNFCIERLYK